MFNGLSTSLLGYGNKKILIDWVLVCVYSILCLFSHWSINQINRFISPCVLSLDSGIVSGLLVYLVYWFISPLFIFPCVLSINQINRFISPCVLSLDSGIVSGLLVYLVYWFISPLFMLVSGDNGLAGVKITWLGLHQLPVGQSQLLGVLLFPGCPDNLPKLRQ